jgi:hypothetical protein
VKHGAGPFEVVVKRCDTYKMLQMTTTAEAVEDKGYHSSWVDREGRSTFDADSELSGS